MPAATEPRLASQQAAFARALVWQDDVPADVTSTAVPRPVRRFNVHRNTLFSSLTETLLARFPVVARLVGDAFFRAMSRHFIEHHPPRSPVLIAYGSDLPAFLESFEPVAGLPYLPDVARLEWLRSVAYHAADAAALNVGDFAACPPQLAAELVLDLHPSVRVLASAYPVLSIWETNTQDQVVRDIGPDAGAEAILIARPRLDVVMTPLTPGAAVLVASIARGHTLAGAADAAFDMEPAFSLPHALAGLIALGAFSGMAHPEGSPAETSISAPSSEHH